MFPEFGAHGPLHFFVPSEIGYLRQNRSGFDLRGAGSILALAALALLFCRRGNLRLLRPEVLALPVVSLGAYALAQAVLFKLYLPHRYTYPLVAFFAIAVGVTIRPTWTALWERPRPRLRAFALLVAPLAVVGVAIYLFPLGPMESLDPSWRKVVAVGGAVILAGAAALLLKPSAAARRGRADRPDAAGGAAGRPGSLGAGQGVPGGRVGRLPREPAEGRGDRRRPHRHEVPARHRAARRGDLDAARALLRGRVLPQGARAGVRDPARLLRTVRARRSPS